MSAKAPHYQHSEPLKSVSKTKRINISKVTATVSGNPVRNLHFKTTHLKSSMNFIERIYGEMLVLDELINARVWISESWAADGTSDAFENDNLTIESVKNSAHDNQLEMF